LLGSLSGQGSTAEGFFVFERVGQGLGTVGIQLNGQADDGSRHTAGVGLAPAIAVHS
jgi:hypothetical protein